MDHGSMQIYQGRHISLSLHDVVLGMDLDLDPSNEWTIWDMIRSPLTMV